MKLALHVEELGERHERAFQDILRGDPVEYFFFDLDYRFERASARFFLALDGDDIRGMLLVYKGRVAHAKGDREAVRLLLDHVDISPVELMVPFEHRDLVVERFEFPTTWVLVAMSLEKGKERPAFTKVPERLTTGDAEALTHLLTSSQPDYWGHLKKEDIDAMFKDRTWLGIKDDAGGLVSAGMTMVTRPVSNIFTIVTAEGHRNKGYATSMVSALVKEIFSASEMAMINVHEGNVPAQKAYARVGFRPHGRFFHIKNGTRRA